MQIYFPGVYVTEVASNAKPIEGVSTSTTDLIGSDTVAALQPLIQPFTLAQGCDQPEGSVLNKLRFFEGRLLDEDDLRTEQDYLRPPADQ
jgi:hypothetical protein